MILMHVVKNVVIQIKMIINNIETTEITQGIIFA